MRILYIYRSLKAGPSIRRVFEPIEKELKNRGFDVDSIYLLTERADFHSAYININFVRKWLKTHKYDVIHITGDVYYLLFVLRRYNTVVTFHDLGFYTNQPKSLHRTLRFLFWIYPLKFANVVTFISEKTKIETRKLVNLKGTKWEVVPNPYDSSIYFEPKILSKGSVQILHVGTKPNKNLERVIQALRGIKCVLTIIGKIDAINRALLAQNNISFRNVDYATDLQLQDEYKHCDIVSFPSLYEGFGLPIIEAQAYGRPVVTSNISPMKEIAGDCAILVEPTSIDSIRDGFMRAIHEYDIVVSAGLKNVHKYNVTTISEQYIKIYKHQL